MNKITTLSELQDSIALLELKQASEGALLKEQLRTTYENLKPINIIKNTFKEMKLEPDFKDEFLNSTLSLTAGFLSKKIAVGSSENPFRKALGLLLQIAVTGIATKNADQIKAVVHFLINSILPKKESKTS